MAHYKIEAEAEQKAELKAKGKAIERKLPDLPTKYRREVLEAAYFYYRAAGQYPFNPRCLTPVSLMDIDKRWCDEFNLYVAGIEWAKNNA